MDSDEHKDGAPPQFPAEASTLEKGKFIVIGGSPCMITHSTGQPKKTRAGAAYQMMFTCRNIFTGATVKKKCRSTHVFKCPIVKRAEYRVTEVRDRGLAAAELPLGGGRKVDLDLPAGELRDGIVAAMKECATTHRHAKAVNVHTISALGKEVCVMFKVVDDTPGM